MRHLPSEIECLQPPGSRIVFRLPRPCGADLRVYDASGRRIATIVSGDLPAGAQGVVWDGRMNDGSPAPAGAYLVRLEADGRALTTKAINVD
jgi:flagellar hook assembly protein FlgD